MQNEENSTLSVSLNQEYRDTLIEQAKLLAASDLLPPAFYKKPANCLLALEIANYHQLAPMMVMQNLYIIHGKPAFSSSFMIALLQKSGKYDSVDFELSKAKDACRVVAMPKRGEKPILGPWITLEMARAEGWSTKTGSKWKTMPELMLRYRAASFFCRTCAPHILMGFQTQDEVEDILGKPGKVKRFATDLLKKNGAENE